MGGRITCLPVRDHPGRQDQNADENDLTSSVRAGNEDRLETRLDWSSCYGLTVHDWEVYRGTLLGQDCCRFSLCCCRIPGDGHRLGLLLDNFSLWHRVHSGGPVVAHPFC